MPNMSRRLPARPLLAALLGCALLAGCQARTNVSATGNAPAQFTHVFLTINQIWFNSSGAAAATDSSWAKFTLPTPQTLDLVNLNNGALSQFVSNLKLDAGSYAQIMLILADSTDALTTSAQGAGAATNDEVDYVDALDVAHTAPLAVLNAAQGISIGTSLTVAASSTTVGGSTSTAPSTTTSTAATSSGATATTVATPGVTITSFTLDFDATRDLVPMSLSGQSAYLLNPHPQAYDARSSGTIQGAVSLTDLPALTSADLPDVQVAAESLSSDGTRHVIIKTTRVGTDGTFVLYPLSTASGAPSSYDLVIHGPTIQTQIIKSVPVTTAAPASATAVLGTLTLTPATPFLVNFNPGSPAAPTSSVVGFYQTLPLPSDVPYLVETRAVDPTSGLFATDQALAGGGVQYGTYVAGGTITLTTANPTQGAGAYSIGAINPAFGIPTLGTTVTAPGTTATALFTMTAAPLPTGASANAITGTVTAPSSQGFDHAALFLTHGGALVAAAALNSDQSTLTLNGIAPGGSSAASYPAGVYYAEVWAWSSSNPLGTLTRTAAATAIDMSAGNAAGVALTIQ